MSGFISYLTEFCCPSNRYQVVLAPTKKDDDIGAESISHWIHDYPAFDDMSTWNTKKINEYVNQLFRNLPSPQICEANPTEIKTHLVTLANCCERAQRAILSAWGKVKLDREVKKNIGMSLVFATPKLT